MKDAHQGYTLYRSIIQSQIDPHFYGYIFTASYMDGLHGWERCRRDYIREFKSPIS